MLALAITPFHASGREMKCMARRGLTHLKFKVLAKSKLFPALFLFAAICCYAANPADCVSRPRWLGGCVALA